MTMPSMRVFNKVVRKLTKRGSMGSVGNNALTASVNSLFAAPAHPPGAHTLDTAEQD